jgi:hypothetical protein
LVSAASPGHRGIVGELVVAEDFLAVAAQVAPLGEGLHQDAHGAGVVLRAEEGAELRIPGVRVVGVDLANAGVEGGVFLEVERLARLDVDRAGDAAFDQAGFRALVHHDAADEFGGQQGVGHAAADRAGLVEHEPVAGGNLVAIHQRLREAGVGAAHADAIILVEAAFIGAGRAGVEAGQAHQRVGDVLVRHLADVLGGDHLHVVLGVALGLQGFFQGGADALHGHAGDGLRVFGGGSLRSAASAASLAEAGVVADAAASAGAVESVAGTAAGVAARAGAPQARPTRTSAIADASGVRMGFI